jgi:GAF domain-containing protein
MCGHAILKDDMLVITDATQDSRFADNPLVIHGPNIRFYAGQPLGGLGGYKMGTLCIIDHRPRTFKKEDRDSLKDLACIVENELSNVQLNQANKRLWEEESLLKYKNEDLQKLNEALQWEIKNRKEAEQDRHRFLKFLWI